MKALSIRKAIPKYTAYFDSMAVKTWPNVTPRNYVHCTPIQTMPCISPVLWLMNW